MAAAEAKKASSGTRKPRPPRAYPSFYEMASDAIVTLKERTGSSQYAIAKFLEEKHPKQLPSNFKRLLLIQLKKFVASGKLVKVKNSYKLPSASARAPSAAPKKPVAPKPRTVTSKPKPKTVAKPKAAAAAAKPKAKAAPAKPKRKAPSTESKGKAPASKVTKTAAKASPAAKKPKKAVAKPKKAVADKAARKPKPKRVKSPAKKKAAAKAKK